MPRQFGSAQIGGPSDKARVLILLGGIVVVVFLVIIIVSLFSGNSAVLQQKPNSVVVEQKVDVPMKMVEVLVPVRNIEAGAALEVGLFRKEPRPQSAISTRIVSDFEQIQGQYARSLILAGQPLHKDYITSVRPVNAITANIPEGHRAVTISVDAKSSVEGWVRPGARVDVAWASNIKGRPGVTVIVQNALVLSAERQTDARVNPGDPVPSTVTLLVTSNDAAKIQLAQTTGALTLQLRGDNDPGKGATGSSITVDDLFGVSNSASPINDCQGYVTLGGVRNCIRPNGQFVPDNQ